MDSKPTYRVVNSMSREMLEKEIKRLANEGWQPLGESAMTCPPGDRPHYWTRTVCMSEEPVSIQVFTIYTPTAA
jgi:hypothetical protein